MNRAVCKPLFLDTGEQTCYHADMEHDLQLKLSVRLCGAEGERIFGPGVATLLHRVEERRSLRAAASSMDMAYSKAWRIIRTAEEGLGISLLDSTVGGHNGGGATLTTAGRRLLSAYDDLCLRLDSCGQDAFGPLLDTLRTK